MLRDEHEAVLDTFEEMLETTSRAVKTRKDQLAKLQQLLLPHMAGEEKVFYPALQQEEQELTFEAYEEHRVAKSVLKDLLALSPDDERWHARCQVLQEIIAHHIEEEESEVFDAAEESFGDDELDEMEQRFEQAKKQAPMEL